MSASGSVQNTASPPGRGARVRIRGGVWRVTGLTRFDDCAIVDVAGVDNGAIRSFLTPFDRVTPHDRPGPPRVVRPRRGLHALRRIAAGAHPFGGLATAAGSRIDILPYQLEPALAVARGATRLLIADAVGMGKTIQAGLVLNELAAAAADMRALVVAPAGLREQWHTELLAHFSLRGTICDAGWLRQATHELPADVSPWILPGIYIVSFDFLKRPEVLHPVEGLTWDALIVDEAHNAGPGTARRAAVHAIGLRSRRVVLLTATPDSGDRAQFDALCAIGRHDGPDPLTTFRRTREAAGTQGGRRTTLLAVRISPSERRMQRMVETYTSRVWRDAGARGDAAGRLAAIVLRKRGLSSAAALRASASRRLHLLTGRERARETQLLLPLGDRDELDDDLSDAALSAPGLTDADEERTLLTGVADAARIAGSAESKARVLIRLLGRTREPAIVFTEYRDTLLALRRALEGAGFPCAVLHGGQMPDERLAVQRAFDAGGSILLATDAASEGLNLQARCRLVIHYELPWSPSRLEQRTGRVDRIGQRRTVHEILLVARTRAERTVLAPLAGRAARAREHLPGASRLLDALTESHAAASILGGLPFDPDAGPLQGAPISPPSHDAPAREECARIETARAWIRASGRPPDDRGGPLLLMSTRRAGPVFLTCVCRMTLRSSSGRVVHARVVAAREPHATTRPTSAAEARRRAHQWLATHEPHARRALELSMDEDFRAAAAASRSALDALTRRERAIAGTVSSAARDLIQAGLFDARATRAGEARRRAAGTLLGESARRRGAFDPEAPLIRDVEVLALIWSRGRR